VEKIKILEFLNELRSGSINKANLNKLIEYCIRISLIYLKRKYANSLYKLPPGTDLNELAVDSVVNLFTRNIENNMGLRTALLKWNNPVTTEAEAQFFIHKIVWHRVEQSLCTFMRESDPFFGRILKTLNYYIKLQGLSKQQYFGIVFVSETTETLNGRIICPDYFFTLDNSLFFEKKDRLFISLLSYLKEYTDYYPAIPLLALARKLKHIKMAEYTGVNITGTIENEYWIYEVTQRALEQSLARLESSYLNKGKLNINEYNWISGSLREICTDLRNGGMDGSLYDYMKHNCINLQKAEFYRDYHQLLDYMVRFLKRKILEQLN